MSVRTYNPQNVVLTLGGVNISGYSDGTFISIERVDNDNFKELIGALGEVSRTKNNNRAAMIKVTIKQTSPSNAVLYGLAANPIAFPVAVVQSGGPGEPISGGAASEAWIKNEPQPTFAAEEESREWTIFASDWKYTDIA